MSQQPIWFEGKMQPDNFCVMPFIGLLVRPDATTSVCCFNSETTKNKSGENIYLYRDAPAEVFSAPLFQDLRKAVLANERHPSCAICWKADDEKIPSFRNTFNNHYKSWVDRIRAGESPGVPIDLTLNLGNLCNLKCRICGPGNSSKWSQELFDLFGQDYLPRGNEIIQSMSTEESRSLVSNWASQHPAFADTLIEWLPKIECLYFLGGEPFLNKKQFEIVEKSVEIGCAKDQILMFTTNGTIFPEQAAKNLWPQFRKTIVNISVDGLEDSFEYQRYGANWDSVLGNINKYQALEHLDQISIIVSVGFFTAYYLPEIFRYWSALGLSISISIVSGNNFDMRFLPKRIKEKVSEKFAVFRSDLNEQCRDHLRTVEILMHSSDGSQEWPKTIESLWFHDQYRKQSFAETFPEFHRVIEELDLWYDYKTQRDAFWARGSYS
jgi:sulfatase maturation enzyme AslB (radical SAM superfamily)